MGDAQRFKRGHHRALLPAHLSHVRPGGGVASVQRSVGQAPHERIRLLQCCHCHCGHRCCSGQLLLQQLVRVELLLLLLLLVVLRLLVVVLLVVLRLLMVEGEWEQERAIRQHIPFGSKGLTASRRWSCDSEPAGGGRHRPARLLARRCRRGATWHGRRLAQVPLGPARGSSTAGGAAGRARVSARARGKGVEEARVHVS